MGRRKLYTDAEKKLLKSYRNKIYYYGRKLKDLMSSANSQFPGAFSFRYDYEITLHNIRQGIGDFDSPDPEGVLLPFINDEQTYYFTDFRQLAIDQGGDVRAVLDKHSKRLGYGSIDEYEEQQQVRGKLHEAKEAYENMRTMKAITSTFDLE